MGDFVAGSWLCKNCLSGAYFISPLYLPLLNITCKKGDTLGYGVISPVTERSTKVGTLVT